MAFFATMVARLVISPVVPAIGDAFTVSDATIGVALSGLWLTYALAQFPSGLLGDRYGERPIILIAVVGTALTSGLIAVACNYWMFVIGAVLLGAVAGLHYSAATTLITRTAPNTGSAIGIHSAGAPIAGLLAPPIAGLIGAQFGWRYAIALGTVTAIPVALFVGTAVRPTAPPQPEPPIRERLDVRMLGGLLSRPTIAITMLLAVIGAFVWQATASFLPTFFIRYHAYSKPVAGVLFSAYFAVQGVGQPVIGSLSDRIGRDPAAALTVLAGTIGYASFVLVDALWALLVAIGLAGIAMSWGAALLPKFMDNLNDGERGIGFGVIRTTYMVLGASGSVVTGWIADTFSWGTAFLTLAGLLGLMLVTLLGLLLWNR